MRKKHPGKRNSNSSAAGKRSVCLRKRITSSRGGVNRNGVGPVAKDEIGATAVAQM
jgi:hypothetical protein